MKRIVSDTSPLISLYDRVLIPPAVLRELAAGPFENEEAYFSHFGIDDLLQVETPEHFGRIGRAVTCTRANEKQLRLPWG